MRGGRSFLVLLVLALGLGGYAYFVESKRDQTDHTTVKAKVFGLEAGKIEELRARYVVGRDDDVEEDRRTTGDRRARAAAGRRGRDRVRCVLVGGNARVRGASTRTRRRSRASG